MHFGEYLRQLRTDKHLTLRELAKRAGANFTLLSKIEQGLRPPPELHVIFALADALKLKPDALEFLLALLTQPPGMQNPRVSPDELERFRSSPSLRAFLAGPATITVKKLGPVMFEATAPSGSPAQPVPPDNPIRIIADDRIPPDEVHIFARAGGGIQRAVLKSVSTCASVPRAWQLLARAFLEAFTQVCTEGEKIAAALFEDYADIATPEEVAVWIQTVARSGSKSCTVEELQTAAERLANT